MNNLLENLFRTSFTQEGYQRSSLSILLKSMPWMKHLSVFLTAQADGQKMKPFVVFKGAKREVSQSNEEFRLKMFRHII